MATQACFKAPHLAARRAALPAGAVRLALPRAAPLRSAPRPLFIAAASAPVADACDLEVLNLDGSVKSKASLALRTTSNKDNAVGVVHKYLVAARAGQRAGLACTKTRSEVRGGGRKPMSQKGSGNARKGSTRSPLFPGGGTSFGPKPKDWTQKINKKERHLALAIAYQSAADNGCLTVVEDLEGKFTEFKTKNMIAALKSWGVEYTTEKAEEEDRKAKQVLPKTLLITKKWEQGYDKKQDGLYMSSRNIGNLELRSVDNASIYDILWADKIIVDETSFASIVNRHGASV